MSLKVVVAMPFFPPKPRGRLLCGNGTIQRDMSYSHELAGRNVLNTPLGLAPVPMEGTAAKFGTVRKRLWPKALPTPREIRLTPLKMLKLFR